LIGEILETLFDAMDIKYFNNLEDSKSLPVAFDETMDKVFQYIFMEEELYPEL
jgi:hypothetical protein